MLASNFYKQDMVRGQGLSKNQRTDAPKLTAGNSRAPATSRGRGGRGGRGGKAVAPVPARRQILVNRPRQDRHDDDEVDSDKENENEELDDLDVRQEEGEVEEEDESEEVFEWKCRLLEIIQQYPEVFDLADPRYKDRNQRDSAWEEIATAMDASGQ